MNSLKTALAEYKKNSAASKGCISCAYSISDGEVVCAEVYNGMTAMDNHIGNCFPSYIKMLAFCTMVRAWARVV